MEKLLKKNFFTTGEIGKLFGVSRISVYKWIKGGKLKAFRIPGGKFRVYRKDLIEFVKKSGLRGYDEILKEPLKILIVDDDKKILETLKNYLEKRNPDFNIICATNGYEAGKKISKFKPDVVILDIFMPGIDGFEVCRDIKTDPSTKDIKVIVITGYGTKENIEKIKKIGADHILQKPFNYEQLAELIETL